jgi:hypothetical protein
MHPPEIKQAALALIAAGHNDGSLLPRLKRKGGAHAWDRGRAAGIRMDAKYPTIVRDDPALSSCRSTSG